MNLTLEAAKTYLKQGLSVIPIQRGTKEPRASWKEYSSRYATETEIDEWFGLGQANIAICTGEKSGLVVVDVDNNDGRVAVTREGLISPVRVVTGRGVHHYFRHPGAPVKNAVQLFPGVDVRGDGGYVVAPPSVHVSGRVYRWECGGIRREALPVFPSRFLTGMAPPDRAARPDNWLTDALKGIRDGNRNDTFTRVVGKLHRDRWTGDSIFELLQGKAGAVGLGEEELRTIIASVSRYPNSSVVARAALPYENGEPLVIRSFDSDRDAYEQRKAEKGSTPDYRTGYTALDVLLGGLRRGEVLTVAARTGVGKTNFLIGASKHLCVSGKRVLFFSTEMAFDAIWDRYIALSPEDGGYRKEPFLVCDGFAPSVSRIEEALSQSKPDVFVFDHVNHVGDEQVVLAEFMKGLKKLARQFDIPCMVSAQLNRMADWVDPKTHERIVPRLSMIKGAGTIEQVSAQVLLLSEIQATQDQMDIIGNVDKNRYGERGVVSFALLKNPWRFVEVE